MKSVWFAEMLFHFSKASAGGTGLPALSTKDQITAISASTTWILGVGILVVVLISIAVLSHKRK